MSILRHDGEIKKLQKEVAELQKQVKQLSEKKKPGPKPKDTK